MSIVATSQYASTHLTRAGTQLSKVVKPTQHYRWCSITNRHVPSAQQKPTRPQPRTTNATLLSLRARYYDPTTGEFTSQDLLDFVDGMSLYRGYFVPGGVDPTGQQSTSNDDIATPIGEDKCGCTIYRYKDCCYQYCPNRGYGVEIPCSNCPSDITKSFIPREVGGRRNGGLSPLIFSCTCPHKKTKNGKCLGPTMTYFSRWERNRGMQQVPLDLNEFAEYFYCVCRYSDGTSTTEIADEDVGQTA